MPTRPPTNASNNPSTSQNSTRTNTPRQNAAATGANGQAARGRLGKVANVAGRGAAAMGRGALYGVGAVVGAAGGLYSAYYADAAPGNAAGAATGSRNAQGSPVRNTATSAPAVRSPRRRRPFSDFLPKIRPSKTARLTSKTGILRHQIKEYENRKNQLGKLEQEALSNVDDFLGRKIQNIHTEIARRRIEAGRAAQKKREAVQKRYASAQRELETLIGKAERKVQKLQDQKNVRNARQRRRV